MHLSWLLCLSSFPIGEPCHEASCALVLIDFVDFHKGLYNSSHLVSVQEDWRLLFFFSLSNYDLLNVDRMPAVDDVDLMRHRRWVQRTERVRRERGHRFALDGLGRQISPFLFSSFSSLFFRASSSSSPALLVYPCALFSPFCPSASRHTGLCPSLSSPFLFFSNSVQSARFNHRFPSYPVHMILRGLALWKSGTENKGVY